MHLNSISPLLIIPPQLQLRSFDLREKVERAMKIHVSRTDLYKIEKGRTFAPTILITENEVAANCLGRGRFAESSANCEMLYKLKAYCTQFQDEKLKSAGARAVIIMTIIAAISNSAAETRCDYSNPKPIAGVAKLYTGQRRGGGDNRAAQFDTRTRADRDVKIKDAG